MKNEVLRKFEVAFMSLFAGGMALGSGGCLPDNFFVDGAVTIRDSALAEVVAVLIGIPLALVGLGG